MPGMELIKQEKKTAREIIERSLQREFAKALSDAGIILNEWKSKALDNSDAYNMCLTNFLTMTMNSRLWLKMNG